MHDRAVVAVEQPTVAPVSEREGVESGREEEFRVEGRGVRAEGLGC